MPLRVLSYNVREGGDGRIPLVVAIVRGQRPDAVALLEANSRANAEILARELGMRLAFGESNDGEHHVAWLSRLPIRRGRNHRLAELSKTLLEIEVLWEGAPLRLFATHLASRHDATRPSEEVLAILEALRPLSEVPRLLVGDLNSLRRGDPVGTPPHGEGRSGDAADDAPRAAIRLILDAGTPTATGRCTRASPGTPTSRTPHGCASTTPSPRRRWRRTWARATSSGAEGRSGRRTTSRSGRSSAERRPAR
jgi:hypothetical protein